MLLNFRGSQLEKRASIQILVASINTTHLNEKFDTRTAGRNFKVGNIESLHSHHSKELFLRINIVLWICRIIPIFQIPNDFYTKSLWTLRTWSPFDVLTLNFPWRRGWKIWILLWSFDCYVADHRIVLCRVATEVLRSSDFTSQEFGLYHTEETSVHVSPLLDRLISYMTHPE